MHSLDATSHDHPPCSVNAQCSHDVNLMHPELSTTGAVAYHQPRGTRPVLGRLFIAERGARDIFVVSYLYLTHPLWAPAPYD